MQEFVFDLPSHNSSSTLFLKFAIVCPRFFGTSGAGPENRNMPAPLSDVFHPFKPQAGGLYSQKSVR
jgi:hypothetical protein